MTDSRRAQTPLPHPGAAPPDTHHQTQKLEKRLTPARHATEPYGKGSTLPTESGDPPTQARKPRTRT